MPLRNLIPIDEARKASSPAPQHSGFWTTAFWRNGLLLATSAALGGIAVAIWNRRTLAQIRQQIPPSDPD